VTLTSHPPSSAVDHERVELYRYSSYGPYGLYRASVSVPLPLPYCFGTSKMVTRTNLYIALYKECLSGFNLLAPEFYI